MASAANSAAGPGGGGRSFFAPEPRNGITTTYERDDDEVPGVGANGQAESAPFLAGGGNEGPAGGSTRVNLGKIGTGSSDVAPAAKSTKWLGLPSILAYCASSIMMTVANKFIVLDKKFNLNLVVLLMQSLIGVTLVVVAERIGWIQLRGLNRKDVKLWFPISVLLVFVIYTGSKAIQHLNVSVYTIFKNLTIILIAYGEVVWFKGRVTGLIFLAFVLMVCSSIVAAWGDISRLSWVQSLPYPHLSDGANGGTRDPVTGQWINAANPLKDEQDKIKAVMDEAGLGAEDSVFENPAGAAPASTLLNSGYVWMAANCLCSAAYVLLMRKRIKVTGFKDWDSMYYNNLLTVPVLLLLSLLVENWSKENFDMCFPAEKRAQLFAAIGFSGFCAMFISWSTAWCIRVTSSTTYSMVGALNKLPLALSGMVFFAEKATFANGLAIAIGTLAGIVYALGKIRQGQAQKAEGGGDGGAPIIPLHKINGQPNLRRD